MYNYSDSKEYSNIFTCFFFSTESIATTNYIISENKLVFNSSISSEFSQYMNNGDERPTFIKSETNYKRTLAFIWFHFSYKHRTYFTTFNLSSNQMEIPSWINNCSSEIYKTKINKFPKNNELASTYEINDKIIRAELYNNIDNIKYNWSSFAINASCENIEGPAIFYYNNNQNYYIYYCFKNCSDELYKNDSYCLNLENKKKSSNRIIIYIIIIIVIVIILLVILIFLYKIYFKKTDRQKLINRKKQTKDEKLINDIFKGLLPSNN